jgi:glycosyltransferase involved in cell wall biosynthesis
MNVVPRRRVGLVIGQLTYGGAESQLYELARGLTAECDVFVYCLSEKDAPYGARLRDLGVAVEVIPARSGLDPVRVVKLARSLRRDRVQVLHAFLFIASAYAYLATRLARGTCLVTSARNCKAEPNALKRRIMTRAFQRSHAIICNSQEMARFAIEYYGAPADRIEVVYNGVDTDRFGECRSGATATDPARTETARDVAALTIGTIGRLEPQKNLDMFLVAAACVRAEIPTARFRIVGEGSERRRLERRARSLGLADSLTFEGTTSDVPGFLRSLDQFWLTSDWEGTPNVVLEAMAAGVAVLATRVGGTPELLEDRRTGILIDAGAAARLCSESLRLARDREASRSLGDEARETARTRFSLGAMVAATACIYDRAAEARE